MRAIVIKPGEARNKEYKGGTHMNPTINLNITVSTPETAIALMQALRGELAPPEEREPAPVGAAPAPASVPEPAPMPVDTVQAPAPEAQVAIEDLRAALVKYRDAHGKEAVQAMLHSYGVEKLSDLPRERYADMLTEVSA